MYTIWLLVYTILVHLIWTVPLRRVTSLYILSGRLLTQELQDSRRLSMHGLALTRSLPPPLSAFTPALSFILVLTRVASLSHLLSLTLTHTTLARCLSHSLSVSFSAPLVIPPTVSFSRPLHSFSLSVIR